ncbi:hypothetical protein EV426DRAFT_195331 [Tirmania nivea]|nr:hypothetical protein EV426DRAFT_195331 [Tirmania nivea]
MALPKQTLIHIFQRNHRLTLAPFFFFNSILAYGMTTASNTRTCYSTYNWPLPPTYAVHKSTSVMPWQQRPSYQNSILCKEAPNYDHEGTRLGRSQIRTTCKGSDPLGFNPQS